MNMQDEPVTVTSLILGFAAAVLAALVGFGVIDADRAALLLGVVAGAIPLAAFFVQRPRVTPNHRVPAQPEEPDHG